MGDRSMGVERSRSRVRSRSARGLGGALLLAVGLAACGTSGSVEEPEPEFFTSAECSCAAPSIEVSPGRARPGEEIVVSLAGARTGDCCDGTYLESTELSLSVEGKRFELGTVELEEGAGSLTVAVPDEALAGTARVVATGIEELAELTIPEDLP